MRRQGSSQSWRWGVRVTNAVLIGLGFAVGGALAAMAFGRSDSPAETSLRGGATDVPVRRFAGPAELAITNRDCEVFGDRTLYYSRDHRYRGNFFHVDHTCALERFEMEMLCIEGSETLYFSVHERCSGDTDWTRITSVNEEEIIAGCNEPGDYEPQFYSSAFSPLILWAGCEYVLGVAWCDRIMTYYTDSTDYPQVCSFGEILGSGGITVSCPPYPPMADQVTLIGPFTLGVYSMKVCTAPQPGVCCTCPAVCTAEVLQPDCLDVGGSWTPGGTCDPNPCPDVPVNDDCVDAAVIAGLDAGPVFADFNNMCATDDGPTTSCAADGADLHFDFWYAYTAEADGQVGISTCGLVAWDSVIAVYDGGTDACVPTIDDEIVCDDNGCGFVNGAAHVYVDVTNGQELLIRVGGRFDPVAEEGNARGDGQIAFALVPNPPSAPTSYPDTYRMNRVLSFTPNNPGGEVAYQLELLEIPYPNCYSDNPAGDVGMTWWVSSPRCTDDAGMDVTLTDPECTGVSDSGVGNIWRSQVTVDPVCHGGGNNDQPCVEDADCAGGKCGRSVWPDGVVHIADCEIIPAAAYALRTTPGPTVPIFAGDLVTGTAERPTPKCWGDIVGMWDMTQWTAPNQVVCMDDIMAAIQLFKHAPSAAHRTWVDVADEGPDMVLNFTDVLFMVEGFKGYPYPFSRPSNCPPGVQPAPR